MERERRKTTVRVYTHVSPCDCMWILLWRRNMRDRVPASELLRGADAFARCTSAFQVHASARSCHQPFNSVAVAVAHASANATELIVTRRPHREHRHPPWEGFRSKYTYYGGRYRQSALKDSSRSHTPAQDSIDTLAGGWQHRVKSRLRCPFTHPHPVSGRTTVLILTLIVLLLLSRDPLACLVVPGPRRDGQLPHLAVHDLDPPR
jgi:hypothetical protein